MEKQKVMLLDPFRGKGRAKIEPRALAISKNYLFDNFYRIRIDQDKEQSKDLLVPVLQERAST